MFGKDVEHTSSEDWPRQTLTKNTCIKGELKYTCPIRILDTFKDINDTCSVRMLNTYREVTYQNRL